jgi:uncharacterized Zn-finger protein
MKTKGLTNVICLSIHYSYTLMLENTLSVFMKKLNHINATFVKNVLVLHQNLKGMYKWFMKNYKCDLCKYSFFQHTDLKKHIECVHEKIKPHKCSICKKSFGHKGNLKSHIQMIPKENNKY